MTYLNTAHDERLDKGMALQQGLLQRAESEGAVRLGWKAGFGTGAWRTTLGLDAPLIGFLLDRTRVEHEDRVSISSWTAPLAEAELALRLGSDVPGDASVEQALSAVDAFAPAIELVDLSFGPEDVTAVLAGGVFHRHWATGDFHPVLGGTVDLSTLVGDVTAMGAALDQVTDVQATTGPAGEVLAEVARITHRHGRGLRSGDIVILGSIVPPQAVAPGGSFRFVLGDHPPIELSFTD